jgi:hypothetical protein
MNKRAIYVKTILCLTVFLLLLSLTACSEKTESPPSSSPQENISPTPPSADVTPAPGIDDVSDAIAKLPQSDAVDMVWRLLDGYWNAGDRLFVSFAYQDGLPVFTYGLWESSALGFGELVGADPVGEYEAVLTIRFPAIEASEIFDAREEWFAAIYIGMSGFEHDGTIKIKAENHGSGDWYTYSYAGKTGEEAYKSFQAETEDVKARMAGFWRMDWPNPDNAVIMILFADGRWESPGPLPTDHTDGGSFVVIGEETGIYRLRHTIEHTTSPHTEIGGEFENYMYDAQNDLLFTVMSSGEGDHIVEFIRE